jgi:hypothetical protein
VVALVEDRIVGFACWTGATLNSLFVAPEHRSTGIGAALLAVMEQRMQAGGATTFDLICVEGNAAGRRFYERHGWRLSHCDVKANAVAGGTAPDFTSHRACEKLESRQECADAGQRLLPARLPGQLRLGGACGGR